MKHQPFFTGQSERYYVKNPHSDTDYSYAVYQNKEAYDLRLHIPEYVTSETAYQDHAGIEKEYYKFEINTPKGTECVFTELTGEVVTKGITDVKDYLRKLYNQYGKDNITYKFSKCTTTNLDR